MSNKFNKSMFDSIKAAMAEQKSKGEGGFRDILKTPIGHNYVVRFVPNVEAPQKTFYHYYHHGWQSLSTGQFTSVLCPTTYGEPCAICQERIKLYRKGDEESIASAKELKRKENWFANVYVVDDPNTPENNGSIKILRYGKQVGNIIEEAIEGDDAEEFGMRIFDLSKEGCNLRLTVKKNDGGFPSYVTSKFLRESEIDGLTAAKIKEIHENIFDLETIQPTKSADEITEMLNLHFYCIDTPTVSTPASVNVTEKDVEDKPEVEDVTETSDDTDDSVEEVDDKLADLIKDL